MIDDPYEGDACLDIKVGDWVVAGPDLHEGLYGPVEAVTAKKFRAPWEGGYRSCILSKQRVVFAGPEAQARKLYNRIRSMHDDYESRQRDAELRHQKALRRVCKEAQDGQ